MPTPYGSRGGMAFGAEELRVLRRALALALDPRTASAQDVQDCLRLADSLDEAMREGARMRAFLLADLARYRAALPGTAAGYLTLLEEALAAGYRPVADDLAALGALRGNPVAAVLLDRCQERLGGQGVRERGARAAAPRPAERPARARLTALPGGLSGARDGEDQDAAPAPGATRAARDDERPARTPAPEPAKRPAEKPAADPAPRPPAPGAPDAPRPARPIPTPGEVFPRRRPVPPKPSQGPRRSTQGPRTDQLRDACQDGRPPQRLAAV